MIQNSPKSTKSISHPTDPMPTKQLSINVRTSTPNSSSHSQSTTLTTTARGKNPLLNHCIMIISTISQTKPTNPSSDPTTDLPKPYPFSNRMLPYTHSDVLDSPSTKSPTINSHGNTEGKSDRTTPGVPTVPELSVLRLPSKNYYIGYALFDDLQCLCNRKQSLS